MILDAVFAVNISTISVWILLLLLLVVVLLLYNAFCTLCFPYMLCVEDFFLKQFSAPIDTPVSRADKQRCLKLRLHYSFLIVKGNILKIIFYLFFFFHRLLISALYVCYFYFIFV